MNTETVKNLLEETYIEIALPVIETVVSDYFNTTPEQLYVKSRKRELVYPRQLICFYSRMCYNSKLKAIGIRCGNKDHATVLAAIREIKNALSTKPNGNGFVNPEIALDVAKLNVKIFKGVTSAQKHSRVKYVMSRRRLLRSRITLKKYLHTKSSLA